MKEYSKWKLATRIGIFIIVSTFIGLMLVFIITSTSITNIVMENTTNQLTDSVESRSTIINNYVSEAEKSLVSFSLGSEVTDLLHNKTNSICLEKAQAYTDAYAESKGFFEGLYIADTDTAPLTHINRAAVGKPTRQGDRLAEMQRTILSKHGLTNIGIMQSPSSGKMVISLYYPLFDDNSCIGYVGAAVYADNLMDCLLDLEIDGMGDSEYIFLDAEKGTYLYNKDSSLLNTEADSTAMLDIIALVKGGTKTGSYTDGDGNFIVYNYLPERSWIFMVQDNQGEIFEAVKTVKLLVFAVCAVVEAMIIAVSLLRLKTTGRELMMLENAIGKLGRLDFSPDSSLNRFSNRGDEVGMIAITTAKVSSTLKNAVGDIDRILGEMAAGNLTVDVNGNASCYVGDLSVILNSLNMIKDNMSDILSNIYDVSG